MRKFEIGEESPISPDKKKLYVGKFNDNGETLKSEVNLMDNNNDETAAKRKVRNPILVHT
jgi:hypothetical protein